MERNHRREEVVKETKRCVVVHICLAHINRGWPLPPSIRYKIRVQTELLVRLSRVSETSLEQISGGWTPFTLSAIIPGEVYMN